MKVNLIAQGSGGTTLEKALRDAKQGSGLDRLDVAVAYATKQGILTLQKALGGFPDQTRWVVGLDDAITQPEALTFLISLPGSELRFAALGPKRRFHPKVYCLWHSTDLTKGLSAVGSGNMTQHGLRENGEAAVLLTAHSEIDVKALKKHWNSLWALGEKANQADLDAYAIQYKKAKAARKKMADAGDTPPVPDDSEPILAVPAFDGTVESASVAWTDFGKAMGNGRELEVPSALMAYFGVQKNGPTPQDRDFYFGHTLKTLPFKKWTAKKSAGKKPNEMWRINFVSEVPGSNVLIRSILNGKQLSSDKAARFEHLGNGSFAVTFVKIGSAAYNSLVSQTKQSGTFKQTTARNYGFY